MAMTGKGRIHRSGSGISVDIPPSARRLLEEIGVLAEAAGQNAFAVGGCVRDWCLGRTATADVDVAVEGGAADLAARFAAARGLQPRVHPQFGTASVGLESGGARVDFAGCRTEHYAHIAAYPRVEPGTLVQDLARRDFSVNAMAVCVMPARFGVLVDPHGGMADLRGRRLRVLHDRSFLDDPTRVLRGIRFARRFGLKWEPQTRRWLDEAVAAGAIGQVNAGRLARELGLMLQEPDPAACLRQLSRLLGGK